MSEAGYRYQEAVVTRLLGEVLVHEDLPRAESTLRSAARVLEEIGARNDLAKGLLTLAEIRWQAGDRVDCLQLLARAQETFEECGTVDELRRLHQVKERFPPPDGHSV
jgi:hypothetical protein